MGPDDVEPEAGPLMRPTNKYVEAMQNISAPELIRGFAETAPAEVQQAVRQTVVSLLGNLPPTVYDPAAHTLQIALCAPLYLLSAPHGRPELVPSHS